VATALDEVAGRARALTGREPDRLVRWAMGEAMARLLGRADPVAVRRGLAERLGAVASEVGP
jgi:Asp-tRNA(Asn)/Glu-tRNA(Gln) amidotransferase B subunit